MGLGGKGVGGGGAVGERTGFGSYNEINIYIWRERLNGYLNFPQFLSRYLSLVSFYSVCFENYLFTS